MRNDWKNSFDLGECLLGVVVLGGAWLAILWFFTFLEIAIYGV